MSEKFNIISILSDDQGVWASGCYGNNEIRTPNIDRLAQTGMRFENFFVATPVCSPSRATMLSGRIPSQHGIHDWIKKGDVGSTAIRYMPSDISYTEILARNGYVCGLSGKWHLGDSQIPQCGFTDWFVHQKGGGDYNNAPMVKNGRLINSPGYITDVITDQAIEYLDRYEQSDGPFYLGVHYTAPHSPWTGHPQHIVDSYHRCPFESCPQEPRHPDAVYLTDQNLGNRESLKGYFAAVTAMDKNIGRIIERIDKLGIRENTLIIFLSDNGFSCGHHGFWGKGNGTNPRNMYENSIKVPAIFNHPGIIETGKVQQSMVSAYDLMPTILDYLNLPLPQADQLPGDSFAPLLKGQPGIPRENVVIYDEYGPVRMIRTKEWKYVYRHSCGPDELYDMVSDPDERKNLINQPDQQKRIENLKGQMDKWFEKYVVPSRSGLLQDGKAMGQVKPCP